MYCFELDIIQATKGILEKKKSDEAYFGKDDWKKVSPWGGNEAMIFSFLEKVKKSQNPTMLYFEAFDRLLEITHFPGLKECYGRLTEENHNQYDKNGHIVASLLLHEDFRGLIELGILMNNGLDPLSVKNEQGQNPFEYFYQQSRTKRISTPLDKIDLSGQIQVADVIQNIFDDYLLKEVHKSIKSQVETTFPKPKHPEFPLRTQEKEYQKAMRRYRIACKKYDVSMEKWAEEQMALYEKLFAQNQTEFDKILPLKKTVNLWKNAEKLVSKKENEIRVTFMNLLKMTRRHPHGAISPEQLEKLVQEKIDQEKTLEKKVSDDYKKGKMPYSLDSEHRRRPSPWEQARRERMNKYVPDREQFPQFPKTRKQAVKDFLLSLQGLTKIELEHKTLLTPKRLRAYHHALNPVKKFERTR